MGVVRDSVTQWLCLVKVKLKLQSVDDVHLFDEKLQVILFDVDVPFLNNMFLFILCPLVQIQIGPHCAKMRFFLIRILIDVHIQFRRSHVHPIHVAHRDSISEADLRNIKSGHLCKLFFAQVFHILLPSPKLQIGL